MERRFPRGRSSARLAGGGLAGASQMQPGAQPQVAPQPVYPVAGSPDQATGQYAAPSVSGAYQPVAAGAAGAAGSTAGGGKPGSDDQKRKRNIIIAVVIAAAVAICAAVGAFFLANGNSQSEDSFPIAFSVNAAGLDTSTGTKVPVKVTGTTAKGAAVDKVVYVGNGAAAPKFAAGTYTISVYASPIASDGTIYDVSSAKTEVTISSDGKVEKEPSLTITPIEASKVTTEQIEAAYQAAKDGGVDNADTAEKLKQAATTRMEDAKKQEQAANSTTQQQTTTQQQPAQEQATTTNDSAASSAESANDAKVQAAFNEGKQVFFGTVYACSSANEVASVTGTKNPNGNTKGTYVVMVFDATDNVRAREGGGSGTLTKSATCLSLPDDLASYAGQHIALAASENQMWFPSGTDAPLGVPRCRSTEVLYVG